MVVVVARERLVVGSVCIVSGSGDFNVRVWDASDGAVLATLEGHTHAEVAVATAPPEERDDFEAIAGVVGLLALKNKSPTPEEDYPAPMLPDDDEMESEEEEAPPPRPAPPGCEWVFAPLEGQVLDARDETASEADTAASFEAFLRARGGLALRAPRRRAVASRRAARRRGSGS